MDVCNRCGCRIKQEDGIVKEGSFTSAFAFGYHSRRDGEIHSFCLCESCYENMILQFEIPVEITEIQEWL